MFSGSQSQRAQSCNEPSGSRDANVSRRSERPSNHTLAGAWIGFTRIVLWQNLHIFNYGPFYMLLAIAVGFALVGIVAFGSLAGSMLPFLLKRIGFDPASASAPFVATLVDVTGLVIYFSVAFLVLHGTLL